MREPAPQVDLPDSEDEDTAGKSRTGADEDERKIKEKKKKSKSKITPALAELGVYTQSVKPPEGTWWLDSARCLVLDGVARLTRPHRLFSQRSWHPCSAWSSASSLDPVSNAG